MLRRKHLTIFAVLAVSGLWLVWLRFVLNEAGHEVELLGSNGTTIEKLGQFGDSFGVLASLMTALAASAAIAAFISQQIDTRVQEFERNFYIILQNLQQIVAEIDVRRFEGVKDLASRLKSDGKTPEQRNLEIRSQRPFMKQTGCIEGRDAIRYLLNNLRIKIGDSGRFSDSKSIASEYESFFRQWHDDLGHYFRTCYHIFKMIDEDCPSNKEKYARIARSHFSNSEIILIAYNCSVGIGRFKFKNYINKYSVLHNMRPTARMKFYRIEKQFFERHFAQLAFRDDGENRAYSYDDIDLHRLR